ncbi:hypothetical protein GDO86_014634 [Hymenochirus boettgeri]|uniref:Uncharacterized protein n=1 Tax=Hymenochirus boettgeri TaxID=247094 RepID=A0A8T2JPV2_9PIPI|nr:hypothetical protein GDO86_014634 [Hymenochirus boettgeri]
MYTLLSGMYKYVFRRMNTVSLPGPDNAGKTVNILEQTKIQFCRNYKGMNLSKITTTVWTNIGTIDVGKVRLSFGIWSHGVIYVIDSTDEARLSESKRAFERMISSEALEGVPIWSWQTSRMWREYTGDTTQAPAHLRCLSIPEIKTAFSDCINKIGRRDCLTQACSALSG